MEEAQWGRPRSGLAWRKGRLAIGVARMLTRSLREGNRLLTHRLRRSFNGQTGGNDGEGPLSVTNRNGAGGHPDLTVSRIKMRLSLDLGWLGLGSGLRAARAFCGRNPKGVD